jgi:6,7-dimethyl-8-ribityllumazine synthase
VKRDGAPRAPRPDCSGKRFAIVVARFYTELGDQLIDGAQRALRECNVAPDHVSVYEVPGSFELPLACRNLIETDRFDALIALGVVIRGQTPHFEYIAQQCARGIMDVQLASGVPVGFGVLTTESLAQAQERADPKRGDKGYAAALAAAQMLGITAGIPRAGFRRNSVS